LILGLFHLLSKQSGSWASSKQSDAWASLNRFRASPERSFSTSRRASQKMSVSG